MRKQTDLYKVCHKHSIERLINRIYQVLLMLPLLRKLVYKIKLSYEVLTPGNEYRNIYKTIKLFGIIIFADLISIYAIFSINQFNFIQLLATFVFLFMLQKEFIQFFLQRASYHILVEVLDFIKKVSHYFSNKEMIDDAVFLSIDGLSDEMKAHARMIYKLLCSSDIKSELNKQFDCIHNLYLKEFISLSAKLMEYGDHVVDNRSLFLTNLEDLCTEIELERLKLEKTKFVFSGKIVITILPMLFLGVLKEVSVSIAVNADSFYFGRGGMIVDVFIILLTAFIYSLISKLKEYKPYLPITHLFLAEIEKIKPVKYMLKNYLEKKRDKTYRLKRTLQDIGETITPSQFIMKQLIFASTAFILIIVMLEITHIQNRINYTSQGFNSTALSASMNEKQYEEVKTLINEYVLLYKDENTTPCEEDLYRKIKEDSIFYSDLMVRTISSEIVNRIENYKKEYFRYYELFIAILFMIMGYYFPYLEVFYRKKIVKSVMDYEVNQFNAIIHMLMHSEHITVKDILEEMEAFAYVFRQPIRACINEYNNGDIKALVKLKDSTKHMPFQYLVDNLIQCDSKSIYSAFEYSFTNRFNYYERRKQENEISLLKKGEIGTLISWIPLVSVGIYMFVPMLFYSLSELNVLLNEILSI